MVQATIALRVDVDTRRGLHEGVPRLLELFRHTGVRASFFVTMGPDRSGAAILRAWRPSFLAKMWRTNPFRLYGLRTLLSGTVLPASPVGGGAPEVLRQIAAEGHEVGPHGFDHVGWQVGVHGWPAARVRGDLVATARALEAILGARPESGAAPGWRTTGRVLAIQEELGYAYASDVRGRAPFRPTVDGRVLATVQVPTTLPTMDELLGAVPDIPGTLEQALQPGLNVFTLHAEVEGGPLLAVFADFLERMRRGGVTVTRLREAVAAAGGPSAFSVRPVGRGVVPGRSGWVATSDPPGEGPETRRRSGWPYRVRGAMKTGLLASLALCAVVSLGGCAGLARPAAEMPPPPPAAPPDVARSAVNPELTRLTEQVTRVANELGEIQNALARLIATSRDHEGQLQALHRRVTELVNQSRDGVGTTPRGFAPSLGGAPPPAPPPPAAAVGTPAGELYLSGLAKFRAGDREGAILVLYDVIANYPSDPARESAQFLVGDILYAQKDLKGALAEFENLLNAAPTGARVPEVLLKIGLCQRGLGDEARARGAWERLLKEYPTSRAAGPARTLLRSAR